MILCWIPSKGGSTENEFQLRRKGCFGHRRRPRNRQRDCATVRRSRRGCDDRQPQARESPADCAGVLFAGRPNRRGVLQHRQSGSGRSCGRGYRKPVWHDRHHGQQRSDQPRTGAFAQRIRRRSAQDGRNQCLVGGALPATRRAQDDAKGRRLHHQRRFDRGPTTPKGRTALQLHQVGLDHDDPHLGQRMGPTGGARQRHCTRVGPYGFQFVLLEESGRGSAVSA